MNLALTVAENVMGGRSPSLRRVSVKPAVEEKGMFRKKKQSESMMVFSFSADEVAGEGKDYYPPQMHKAVTARRWLLQSPSPPSSPPPWSATSRLRAKVMAAMGRTTFFSLTL